MTNLIEKKKIFAAVGESGLFLHQKSEVRIQLSARLIYLYCQLHCKDQNKENGGQEWPIEKIAKLFFFVKSNNNLEVAYLKNKKKLQNLPQFPFQAEAGQTRLLSGAGETRSGES